MRNLVEAAVETLKNDSQWTHALVLHTAEKTDERARHRESRRFTVASIVTAAFAVPVLLGFGTLVGNRSESAIRRAVDDGTFASTIARQVESSVDEQVGAIRNELTDTRTYLQLAVAAQRLDLADSFSNEDITAIRSSLLRLRESPRLLADNTLPNVLGQILESYSAAGRADAITGILEIVPDQVFESRVASNAVANEYAQQLLLNPNPPSEWPHNYLVYFEQSEKALIGFDLPEIVAPWRLMLESRRAGGKRTEELDRWVANLAEMRGAEIADTIYAFFYYGDPEYWQARVTPRGSAVASQCQAIRMLYGPSLLQMLQGQDGVARFMDRLKRSVDGMNDKLGRRMTGEINEFLAMSKKDMQ